MCHIENNLTIETLVLIQQILAQNTSFLELIVNTNINFLVNSCHSMNNKCFGNLRPLSAQALKYLIRRDIQVTPTYDQPAKLMRLDRGRPKIRSKSYSN